MAGSVSLMLWDRLCCDWFPVLPQPMRHPTESPQYEESLASVAFKGQGLRIILHLKVSLRGDHKEP